MKKFAMFLVCALLLTMTGCAASQEEVAVQTEAVVQETAAPAETAAPEETVAQEASFTYWAEEAEAVQELVAYVEAVTDESSSDFIPLEDRIAIFDLDGTLYCETFPIYGEWILFSDYVLNTEGYEAPAHIQAVAEELASITWPKDIPGHMEETHIHAHAEAFAGMPISEYYEVVDAYKATEAYGFSGMTRGEAFYKPMLEVVDYLLENDFIVYICSGTNRFTVRGLIDGVIDIPARQVIGTDFTIVASGQGEETDMHYTFTAEDELLMGDKLITKNVKMSKVAQMEQELGQKPVLVFGNSSGDVPMAVYATEENPYKTAAFFLLCDDVVRERGNLDKAASMEKTCVEKGWTTISMANDWTTIFGDDVVVVE